MRGDGVSVFVIEIYMIVYFFFFFATTHGLIHDLGLWWTANSKLNRIIQWLMIKSPNKTRLSHSNRGWMERFRKTWWALNFWTFCCCCKSSAHSSAQVSMILSIFYDKFKFFALTSFFIETYWIQKSPTEHGCDRTQFISHS